MTSQLTIDADLELSVDIPGSRTVNATLRGSGRELELRVSRPDVFAGRADSASIRGLARTLADHGLAIAVVTPAGPLVTLGAVRTSWLQRRVTRSPHLRIEGLAGLRSLLRGRRLGPAGGALPAADLVPPGTLFPVVPTLARRRRSHVTTTHDPDRGGNPRLTLPLGPYAQIGDRPTVFRLRDDVTAIGSAADCDIRLDGLEPVHAEVRHDERDDFVLVRIGAVDSVRVHGAAVDTAILATGCGIDIGEWQLSYVREEYADHGRPYGGRIGGELGHQRPQPSREVQLGLDEGDR
jgi:hypothetical protein